MSALCGFCSADRDGLEPHSALCSVWRAVDDELARAGRVLTRTGGGYVSRADVLEDALIGLRRKTARLLEVVRAEVAP